MKLIYIRSTMEPKNYSTIRSILKKEQGEKIAPYIFKINDTQTLEGKKGLLVGGLGCGGWVLYGTVGLRHLALFLQIVH